MSKDNPVLIKFSTKTGWQADVSLLSYKCSHNKLSLYVFFLATETYLAGYACSGYLPTDVVLFLIYWHYEDQKLRIHAQSLCNGQY